MENLAQLDTALTEPSGALVHDLATLDGDLLILGCAGKMGPTLARLAQRASEQAGGKRQVIGVPRFSDGGIREGLEIAGSSMSAYRLKEG